MTDSNNDLQTLEVNTYNDPDECGYERGRCFNDCIDGSAWISFDL
jgi:hypothetical protein